MCGPMTSPDLDQQIRAAIDQIVMHPTSTHKTLQLADALRSALDLIDDEDPPPIAAMLGDSIRIAIAHTLDLMDGEDVMAELAKAATTHGFQPNPETTS